MCGRFPGAATSHCGVAGFAGTDANHLLDRSDENLAVADLSRARGLDDRLDRALDERIAKHHFHLDFRQEIDDVLGAAIELGMPFLAAEALDFGDRQTRDADLRKGLAHFVELDGLDDRLDLFHGSASVEPAVAAGRIHEPTGTRRRRVVSRSLAPRPLRSPTRSMRR